MKERWNVAIYLRISNDDGDKNESDSISSQRILIKNYIKNNLSNYEIIGEFIDDGYTGTNFKRPDFQRMIKLADGGEINCIIVKDLSRFGRDYIGVGEYIEKYFPLRDIRFIAINDGYDNFNSNSNDDFIMPIKNIFNAQYSKDISKKVKSSFRSLQYDGKFIGAFASYGYKKSENDKHKLVIDEAAAIVVRRIFELYNKGVGKITIAKKLNDENIPCPSEYKRLSGLKYTNGNRIELTKYWTYCTVHNILRNQMYIGNMVQNKSVRKVVRGKAKKNDTENWIVIKNTHEPIISKEVWDITQELLRKNTRQLDFHENVGLFAGYIFCGDCGRAMSKVTNKYKTKETTTYICGTYKRYGKGICKRNAIDAQLLEKIVLDKLNEQLKKVDEIKYEKRKKNSIEPDLSKYHISLEKINKMKKSLYEDYKDGILTKEEYLEYKNDYSKEEELIKGQIDMAESLKNIDDVENTWINTLTKHKNIEKLDRETVAEILDKIVITSENESLNVNVVFKFSFL